MIIKSHPNNTIPNPQPSAGNIADDFDLNKLEKAQKWSLRERQLNFPEIIVRSNVR
jgi:hypothetical protein